MRSTCFAVIAFNQSHELHLVLDHFGKDAVGLHLYLEECPLFVNYLHTCSKGGISF